MHVNQAIKLMHLHAVATHNACGFSLPVPLSQNPAAVAARARYAKRSAGLAELAAAQGLQRQAFESSAEFAQRVLATQAAARAAYLQGEC